VAILEGDEEVIWDGADWIFPVLAAISGPMIGIGYDGTPWLLITGLVFLVIGFLGCMIFN